MRWLRMCTAPLVALALNAGRAAVAPLRAQERAGVPASSRAPRDPRAQELLDVAIVNEFPSAIFLPEPPPGADTLVAPMVLPPRVRGPVPDPSAKWVVAMHDDLAPGLAPVAVGEPAQMAGAPVPERGVTGTVVARRHYMHQPQPNGPWRYGWGYLIVLAPEDRNPSSRFGGWLAGAFVRAVPAGR